MTPFFRFLAGPVLALTAAARLGSCERHEPDHATTVAALPGPKPAAPAPPENAPRAVCEVPFAEEPPKKASPAADCPADPTGPLPLPRGWVSFSEAPGAPRVAVEIAATEASRERGLMYRVKMPEDQGMIFDFEDSAQRSFWMRNTCIPLDMLFIAADGTIRGVLEQVPPLDESPRGVPCPVSHVLELNAGWTRAHGIRPGQHVRIES